MDLNKNQHTLVAPEINSGLSEWLERARMFEIAKEQLQLALNGIANAELDPELARNLIEPKQVANALMDLYDVFTAGQTRYQEIKSVGGTFSPTLEEAFIRADKAARELLSQFDIQPEHIILGETKYDRRLHNFILARESSHPTHSIIEVRHQGFRKMSNGDTLRIPEVVVAKART